MLVSRRRTLNRSKTLELLGNLAETSANDTLTLYLPPRLPHEELEKQVKRVSATLDIRDKIIDHLQGKLA